MFRFLALLLMLAAAPAAAQGTFASERISVEVTGSGPDVVLIPGLNSSPRVWDATVAALPGYRYHIVQISGFAGRPAGANADGPVLVPVAEEIARYIAEAHLNHPAIVGHSMGGSLGIIVTARHPGLASRLMVIDMMPYLGAMFRRPGSTDEQLAQMAEQVRGGIAGSSGEQRRIQTNTMIASMVRTESARAALTEQSLTSDPAVSGQSFYDLILTNLLPDIANIHVPLLVLYVQPAGAPLTPEQIDNYYRISYRAAPQAVVRRVPDSAHFVMIDQPAVFQTALREFLTGAPSSLPAPPAPPPAPAPTAPPAH
jgi:pimeloyl-ACP methyl ester carboxylesterase